ncbi:MAG: heterodisulfide reductase-related iron-sulfur binding cluster [Thermoanaerobaculia bacterium]
MRPDHGAGRRRSPIIVRVEGTGARYLYEPGCYRPPAGREGDAGLLDAVRALGLELEVVDEGAGDAPGALTLNGLPAYTRVARLLSLAARLGRGALSRRPPTVVSPCTACFRNLSRARQALATHTDLRQQVDAGLADEGFRCEPGAVRVRHLLDVLWEDVGPAAVRARVSRPLSGLRVAAYYGCLDVRDVGTREARAAGFETRFEQLLEALGADAVDLPLRSHCCGGRASEASAEVAASLVGRIRRSAAERQVDVIAVACPRCRRNLSTRPGTRPADAPETPEIPVRYFTELMAEAFSLESRGPTRRRTSCSRTASGAGLAR